MSGFSVWANENGRTYKYKVTAESLGIDVPKEVKARNRNFVPLEDIEELEKVNGERALIEQPHDFMYFYFMLMSPIVENVKTGKVGVDNSYKYGVLKNSREFLYGSYTKEKTMGIYQDIINDGYNILGWEVTIRFRFDYNNPVRWTHSIDGQTGITELVPYPFNPYQPYDYKYRHYFQSNPLEFYNTSLAGSVRYYDKRTSSFKDGNFSAMVAFNTN